MSDTLLKITPQKKDANIRYKLSAVLDERIWQQKPRDMDYEEWETMLEDWKDVSPAIDIKDSAKYFFSYPGNTNFKRF